MSQNSQAINGINKEDNEFEDYEVENENKGDDDNTELKLKTDKLSIKSEKEEKLFQIDNGKISGLNQYSTYSNNKLVHDKHIKHIRDTNKFETDNNYSAGSFNKFRKIYYKTNNGKKVKTNTGFLEAKNAISNICKLTFNNAFIPALLSVCGEETIPNGIFNNKVYLQALNGNLRDLYETNKNHNDVKLIFNFLSIFNTCKIDNHDTQDISIEDIVKGWNDDYSIDKVLLRHLCKVFLLQMYDRKPDNLLVGIDRKAQDNEEVYFVEADFDNNIVNQEKMHCIFNYNINGKNKGWNEHLEQLVERYKSLRDGLKANKKLDTWNEHLKELVDKYTMTIDKIKNVIIKTTINAKYINMKKEDIIKNLKETICRWKEMLKDEENGNIIEKIPYIKEARTTTLEALKKIKAKDIEAIVNNVMILQYGCDDRIYNKDDFYINDKDKQETNNIKKLTNDDFYINYTINNKAIGFHFKRRYHDKMENKKKNEIKKEEKISERTQSIQPTITKQTNKDNASKACNMVKEEQKRINRKKKEREAQEKQNAKRIKRDYKEINVSGNVPMKFTKVNFNKIKEIIEEANKKKNKNKTQNKKSKKNTKTLNQGNKKGF